jgi:hypothetical protein
MTEQEINELGPRDLDAQIAQEIFGWTKHPDAMHPSDNRTISGVLYCPPGCEGMNGGSSNCVPYYSGDIGDAWLVVTALVERGKVFIVKGDGLRRGDHEPKWTVLCDNQPRTDANSASLAICRAALKAYLL